MERLPEDKILQYNPDTMVAVRKMYNLDKPSQMDEAIDLLEAWVKKQPHFAKKDFSREYLERVLILLKGSVERAKAQLDKLCTLRTLLPNFFSKYDAKNDFKEIQDIVDSTLLPKLTKDHRRIFMMRFTPNKKYSSKLYFQIYMYNILICEYLKSHDYSDGNVAVIDFRNVDITDFVMQINLSEMRQVAAIVMEGYDSRAKNFFILSTSKGIEVLVNIFKQMLSEKLGKRIYVLKSVEELHERISKELLPSDYGGNEKPLAELHDELLNVMSSEENIKYLKQMSKACTDESKRSTLKFNEQYLGLPGTFRTLSVD